MKDQPGGKFSVSAGFIELGHEDGQKMLLLACYLHLFIIVSDEAVRSS